MSLSELVLGPRIPDEDAEEERLGVAEGVPVLGLDALASAAYGPEAALTVLLPLGAAGLHLLTPVMAAIVILAFVVQLSYRQTIGAYPNGGGSYTVARENLGERPGLVAAAALALDYLLNVAVAISAGVGALCSAVPALLPHTLALCLLVLAGLTLVNLRGLRAAGLLFLVPTWGFVALLVGTIAIGVAKTILSGGHPAPAVPPPALPPPTVAASIWLVLHAFASGCTALTGVEAVSNGVPVFREPKVLHARRTLALIVGVLCLLLAGIATLSRAYVIGATPPGESGYQSVLSQLVAAVAGRGAFYYVTLATILTVLCLSANTSFADFPRLCRVLALDEYLPEAFSHAGRRLVYSTGIIVLAALAALLLVAFGGITDRLIPLFAVGAFTAFTLSQAGMVAHWRRVGGTGAGRARAVNALGATLTGAALAVIAVAKFREGAWIVVFLVPAIVLAFHRTRAHHEKVRRAVETDAPLFLGDERAPIVVVPLRRLDRVARQGLRFALSISPDVHAVQVLSGERPCDGDLAARWDELVVRPARAAGLPAPRLVQLRTHYRQVLDPIAQYARRLSRESGERFVGVVVPELVERRWYHFLLHSHTATVLKMLLLFRCGPRVAVINTPWFLREPKPLFHRRSRAPHPGLSAPAGAR